MNAVPTTIPSYSTANRALYGAKVTKTGDTWCFSQSLPFDIGDNSFTIRAKDGKAKANATTQHYTYHLNATNSGFYEYDDNGNQTFTTLFGDYDPEVQGYTLATSLNHYTWETGVSVQILTNSRRAVNTMRPRTFAQWKQYQGPGDDLHWPQEVSLLVPSPW